MKITSTPSLLTIKDAIKLSVSSSNKLYKDHVNPGQLEIQKKLGFAKYQIESAQGMELRTTEGVIIRDYFCGFGSVALGHNHPAIIDAQHISEEEKLCNICMAIPSRFVAALAHNLSMLAPKNLNKVFLSTSGAEAIEYALKIAEKSCPATKKDIAYASASFHGKTRGALSVTDSTLYQADFERLHNCKKFIFGNIESLRKILDLNPTIGTLIIETVQGGAGIRLASDNFWKYLREETKRRGIVWIADEVQCGLGRTGKLFAFEHYDVSPDIIVLAKALGGGSEAIGACLTSENIYDVSYGKNSQAFIHSPATFSGITRSCLVATTVLNVLYDEDMINNAQRVGSYLLGKLSTLALKYPRFIKEIRGKGLLIGIEFNSLSKTLPLPNKINQFLEVTSEGYIAALIGSLLLTQCSILVGFTQYNKNVIRIAPPLSLSIREASLFIEALDQILESGLRSMVSKYIKE